MITTINELNRMEEFCIKRNKFNFTSWNIYFAIMHDENRLKLIREYLESPIRKPDILFTQETFFYEDQSPKSRKLGPSFLNYTNIYWTAKNSSISINFNNNLFKLNSNIIRLGLNDSVEEKRFYNNNILYWSDLNDVDTKRPMLGVKLKHNYTGKDIIFISLWAPHHIIKNNKFNNFINSINKILDILYTGSERVIMAGDFNEFYEQSVDGKKKSSNKKDVKILNLTKNIKLYLKQNKNTCCGSTNMKRSGGLFNGRKEDYAFDLYYDSDQSGSVVRVGTNRVSDHLPVNANVTIL